MPGEWLTATGASQALGISERTLRRRANQGKIESKVENRRRLFWVDTDRLMSDSPVAEQLKKENEYLRQELEKRNQQISNMQQQTEQQNAIIMQLTRQLEQSQRLLEYHKEPFWRRWFKRSKEGG